MSPHLVRNHNTIILFSKSPSETFCIGKTLGEILECGDCVALKGELGAGKTCLTQGIAKGLGVPEGFAVTSPTFTLLNEYPGRKTALYHLDVYRLTGSDDLTETGFEEYLACDGVMVIEWADKIERQIPEQAIIIKLFILEDNVREIELSGCPEKIDFWEYHLRSAGY